LLMSPLVAAFGSLVGAPTWCVPAAVAPRPAAGPPRGAPAEVAPTPVACPGSGRPSGEATGAPPLRPWYRSQGVLAVLAWVVMALGALALLRAGTTSTLGQEAGLLAFLVFLPSASSAVVQLFHPQDILSLGLALGGLAQALRRRWAVAGLLFGLALVTKQYALLLALPALAAAPTARARLRMVLTGVAVVAAALLPFLLAAPRATIDNLSGVSGGGSVVGATVVSLAGASGHLGSAVARGAPVVFASLVCLWAWRRLGPALVEPRLLLSLALVCVGSRLIFESVVFPYYLLATSVVFFALDLVARRLPVRALCWCAAAAFFVSFHPSNRYVLAFGTLVLSLVTMVAGFADLGSGTRQVAPAA
ncbi:MAG TPA: glycosyltransferase 87 family protein, partial [Acidimicrobiales bacterium]